MKMERCDLCGREATVFAKDGKFCYSCSRIVDDAEALEKLKEIVRRKNAVESAQ